MTTRRTSPTASVTWSPLEAKEGPFVTFSGFVGSPVGPGANVGAVLDPHTGKPTDIIFEFGVGTPGAGIQIPNYCVESLKDALGEIRHSLGF